MDSSKIWERSEWQWYANKLVATRVGKDNHIAIPDSHGGDYGLECYTTTGLAYQMYCPDEPLKTKDRYERQRNKITEDINKFINNRDALQKLIYGTKIHRWILLVPIHNSAELLKHANAKSELVRSANLPYVAEDFRVMLEQFEDYAEEDNYLTQAGIHKLNIKEDGDLDKNSIPTSSVEFNNNIERKLQKLSTNPGRDIGQAKEAMIKQYIVGSNIIGKLRMDYPDFWEQLQHIKHQREDVLPIESLDPTINRGIMGEIQKMKEVIKSQPDLNFHDEMLEKICWESIVDWLMRCPLDFES